MYVFKYRLKVEALNAGRYSTVPQ